MLAYHLPQVSNRAAKESTFFAAIKRQIPDREGRRWLAYEHPEGGTLLVLGGDPLVRPELPAFGDPVPRDDGTFFLPSRQPLDLMDALKDEISRPRAGTWITLDGGVELFVPVAEISEVRYVLHASGTRKATTGKNAFGVLARELEAEYQRKDDEINHDNVRSLETRLVIAAIHAAYEVTDDQISIEEVFSLTANDIDHIVYIALGYDPKGYAAALRLSLSSQPAAESPTFPSQPPSTPPLLDGPSDLAVRHG